MPTLVVCAPGEIPSSIGRLTNLTKLDLSSNDFSGTISSPTVFFGQLLILRRLLFACHRSYSRQHRESDKPHEFES